jgi:hypothetical protein
MTRWLVGLAVGLALGTSAQAEEEVGALSEVAMGTIGRGVFKVPHEYGHLVSVAVSSEVHYLYFEDEAGTIRVVPLGQRGAVQRARAPVHLLSPIVYVIERGIPAGVAQAKGYPGRQAGEAASPDAGSLGR